MTFIQPSFLSSQCILDSMQLRINERNQMWWLVALVVPLVYLGVKYLQPSLQGRVMWPNGIHKKGYNGGAVEYKASCEGDYCEVLHSNKLRLWEVKLVTRGPTRGRIRIQTHICLTPKESTHPVPPGMTSCFYSLQVSLHLCFMGFLIQTEFIESTKLECSRSQWN